MERIISEKIKLVELKKISNTKGDIFHAMKVSESSFSTFGEAYFSFVNKGEIKGWKKHTKMRLNIAVPLGLIKFYLYDEALNFKYVINLGPSNYLRLVVEPGVWMAFEGIEDKNMLLNIASIEHDPNESINEDFNTFKHLF